MCEQICLAFFFSLKKGVRIMSNIKQMKKSHSSPVKMLGPMFKICNHLFFKQSPLKKHIRVKTSGKLSKPKLLTNVLVFINTYIFFNILKLDLGVYINDVNNATKQYFVSLVMIYF